MGIEHPFLALVASMLFASMFISIVFTFVWITYQLQRIPVVEGFTSLSMEESSAVVRICLRLVRGGPIALERVLVETDYGIVELTMTAPHKAVGNATLSLRLEKFSGILIRGQEAYLIVDVENPQEVYGRKTEYGVIVVFDSYVFSTAFSYP